jgi:hypothetical protein
MELVRSRWDVMHLELARHGLILVRPRLDVHDEGVPIE